MIKTRKLIDPTMTTGLRRFFNAEIRRQYSRLRLDILRYFENSNIYSQEVEGFTAWLQSRLNEHLIGPRQEQLWSMLVEEAFRRGVGRAYDDVIPKDFSKTKHDLDQASRSGFLRGIMGSGVQTITMPTTNVFCATGEGGGVDPSCSFSGAHAKIKTGDDLVDHFAQKYSVMLDLELNKNSVFVNHVEASEEGTGEGTKTLKEIQDFARKTGRDVRLVAAYPYDSPTKAEDKRINKGLIKFYERLGFKAVKDNGMQQTPSPGGSPGTPMVWKSGPTANVENALFGRVLSNLEMVKTLAKRAWTEFVGGIQGMANGLAKTFLDGQIKKATPRQVAREMSKQAERQRINTTTTVSDAVVGPFNEGMIVAFEPLGVTEVGVAVEWRVKRNEDGTIAKNVCGKCRDLEGIVITTQEASGLFPRHPRCQCALKPITRLSKDSKVSRGSIISAIQRSRRQKKGKAAWGSRVKIAQRRPRITKNFLSDRIDMVLANVFCPTGEGGGVDPTCGKGGVPKFIDEQDRSWSDNMTFKEFLASKQVKDGFHVVEPYVYEVKDGVASIRKDLDAKYDFKTNGYNISERELPPENLLDRVYEHRSQVKLDSLKDLKPGTSFGNFGENEFHAIYVQQLGYSDVNNPSWGDNSYSGKLQPGTKLAMSRKEIGEAVKKHPDKSTQDALQAEGYHGVAKLDVRGDAWEIALFSNRLVGNRQFAANVFCPNGPGGGVDPTCSPSGEAGTWLERLTQIQRMTKRQLAGHVSRLSGRGNEGVDDYMTLSRETLVGATELHERSHFAPETVTPQEWLDTYFDASRDQNRPIYNPNILADINSDGVTDHARVGVPADTVPPPPPMSRLPNLTPHERAVEQAFIDHYEKDPDKLAREFRQVLAKNSGGGPKTFGTDDAKEMVDVWSHPDQEIRLENRAKLNLALHQTANALTKRAFIQELDTLPPGSEVLVTVGGCGAGKGYALKNVPEALAMKKRSAVVWDSAGDQNATENPWIQREAEKRGMKVNYVYVHAHAETQWAHPQKGVVKRAGDVKDGRMVDAKVFADSYAIGAKNHAEFAKQNANNPHANFIYLDNNGKPELINGMPKEALRVNRDKLYKFASESVMTMDVPNRVKHGATAGRRVWREEHE